MGQCGARDIEYDISLATAPTNAAGYAAGSVPTYSAMPGTSAWMQAARPGECDELRGWCRIGAGCAPVVRLASGGGCCVRCAFAVYPVQVADVGWTRGHRLSSRRRQLARPDIPHRRHRSPARGRHCLRCRPGPAARLPPARCPAGYRTSVPELRPNTYRVVSQGVRELTFN